MDTWCCCWCCVAARLLGCRICTRCWSPSSTASLMKRSISSWTRVRSTWTAGNLQVKRHTHTHIICYCWCHIMVSFRGCLFGIVDKAIHLSHFSSHFEYLVSGLISFCVGMTLSVLTKGHKGRKKKGEGCCLATTRSPLRCRSLTRRQIM